MSNKLTTSILIKSFVFTLALTGIGVAPAYAQSIKKCQDEAGRWHYGDAAAEACERSKVIEMSEGGAKKKEIDAPPTLDELAAREEKKKEQERLNKLAEKQKQKDKLLLSTYGHEKDIIYVRDRKLKQIDYNIKASENTVKALRSTLQRQEKQGAPEENIKRTTSQIQRHEAVVTKKHKEREMVKIEFDGQLERYRALKSKQAVSKSR